MPRIRNNTITTIAKIKKPIAHPFISDRDEKYDKIKDNPTSAKIPTNLMLIMTFIILPQFLFLRYADLRLIPCFFL